VNAAAGNGTSGPCDFGKVEDLKDMVPRLQKPERRNSIRYLGTPLACAQCTSMQGQSRADRAGLISGIACKWLPVVWQRIIDEAGRKKIPAAPNTILGPRRICDQLTLFIAYEVVQIVHGCA
jgi:hypothetical protein